MDNLNPEQPSLTDTLIFDVEVRLDDDGTVKTFVNGQECPDLAQEPKPRG